LAKSLRQEKITTIHATQMNPIPARCKRRPAPTHLTGNAKKRSFLSSQRPNKPIQWIDVLMEPAAKAEDRPTAPQRTPPKI
jgi:hypothetical protein